jgi:actin-related protein 8
MAPSAVGTPLDTIAPELPVPGRPVEESDPTVPPPLDELVVTSLLRYYRHLVSSSAKDAEGRLRAMASSIMIVGGGAQLPGMAELLQDRVTARLNEKVVLPQVAAKDGSGFEPPVEVAVVVSNKVPREVDGKMVCWKGGSVLGRMEVGLIFARSRLI